ncbi:UNVERIFIED_ORG: hypothetical protein DFO82_1115 [Idiomarina abyssalis]|uniref:hypothetical protein n=1 Tax=Idiomarina sp. 017G TaxID=2183988 RepID=UPI000E0FC920|nr:hypothetical protein [Idiomarina sp. 017G]TDO51876.1 hypothetical protein DEU30_10278 [Idiomarina sp. 017G]
MNSKPKVGLYVSSKGRSLNLRVEGVYGDSADFFLVEVVGEDEKDDPLAIAQELDNQEWEQLVKDDGLKYVGE